MKSKILAMIFGVTTFALLIGSVVFALSSEKVEEVILETIEGEKEDVEQVKNEEEMARDLLLAENLAKERKDAEKKAKELEVQKIEEAKKIEEEKKAEEEAKKPFKFVVIADSESYKNTSGYEDVFESILIKAKSTNPDLAIFSGDLITFTNPNEKNKVVNLKKLLQKHFPKFYITFGKHDIECGAKCVDIWEETFFDEKLEKGETRKLYHSFNHGNSHFVLISSDFPEKHSVDNEQLAWLEKDLAENKKENIIVVAHVSPVSFFEESAEECHDMSCSEAQRAKLLNLLKKHKVDLVISGHEHVFDHKIVDGIDFVLAGAIGKSKRYKNTTWKDSFLQISVEGKNINLKSLDDQGGLIREIKIK